MQLSSNYITFVNVNTFRRLTSASQVYRGNCIQSDFCYYQKKLREINMKGLCFQICYRRMSVTLGSVRAGFYCIYLKIKKQSQAKLPQRQTFALMLFCTAPETEFYVPYLINKPRIKVIIRTISIPISTKVDACFQGGNSFFLFNL